MPVGSRFLTALPVYNEAKHVHEVLDQVSKYAQDILVVDDGSTDGTSDLLTDRTSIKVVRHEKNRGYGAALRTAFQYAIDNRYSKLITIDCDGQHEPGLIRDLAAACEEGVDLVSGSRYLGLDESASELAPADRRRINQTITGELNDRFGLSITDAFCGFKAYRVCALKRLSLTDDGYAMPLELWVQAAYNNFRIREIAVPLVYLEEERSFGGSLDDAEVRLAYYRRIVDQAVAALPKSADKIWTGEDCPLSVEQC